MIQQSLTLVPGVVEKPLTRKKGVSLRVAGLFAGIGGIEVGLEQAGHETTMLCEIDDAATEVLKTRIAGAVYHADVRSLRTLPDVELLTAGFPCQDLSISGQRNGISGKRSGLVEHVFRLIDTTKPTPRWVLLENVPFMLQLQKGKGMEYLIRELEQRGFRWAYRIVDTRAFGLPQRRARVLLLASKDEDPRNPLLGSDSNGPTLPAPVDHPACGFYWTEGHRGIGWSENSVPPIKVGSGVGIPSPPAIWNPENGAIFMPDIRDVERLQGFEPDWTAPAEHIGRQNSRWGLVGNSVSVPLAKWIGERLLSATPYNARYDWRISGVGKWPRAAWGGDGKRFRSSASMWPVSMQLPSLSSFLMYPGHALSPRAAAGLLNRLSRSGTRVPDSFRKDLTILASRHLEPIEDAQRSNQPTSSPDTTSSKSYSASDRTAR
jgi:DNA (cytosine-5)-methyltransferase 1